MTSSFWKKIGYCHAKLVLIKSLPLSWSEFLPFLKGCVPRLSTGVKYALYDVVIVGNFTRPLLKVAAIVKGPSY